MKKKKCKQNDTEDSTKHFVLFQNDSTSAPWPLLNYQISKFEVQVAAKWHASYYIL